MCLFCTEMCCVCKRLAGFGKLSVKKMNIKPLIISLITCRNYILYILLCICTYEINVLKFLNYKINIPFLWGSTIITNHMCFKEIKRKNRGLFPQSFYHFPLSSVIPVDLSSLLISFLFRAGPVATNEFFNFLSLLISLFYLHYWKFP